MACVFNVVEENRGETELTLFNPAPIKQPELDGGGILSTNTSAEGASFRQILRLYAITQRIRKGGGKLMTIA